MKRNVVKGEEEERGLCDLCGMQRGNIMEERERGRGDRFVCSQSVCF